MDRLAKVVWSEGMLLRPQHFQQQDRYLYQVANQREKLINPNGYGLQHIEIDKSALALGQLTILSMSGILPDGMPFNIDAHHSLSLAIPEDCRNEQVMLSVAIEKHNGVNLSSESNTRFSLYQVAIIDESQDDGLDEELNLARLNPCLQLAHDDKSGRIQLPILRILELIDHKQILLDTAFVPPCLDIRASHTLTTLLREITAMIKQRADALAVRMHKANKQSASVLDILMLQSLNRWQPLLAHFLQGRGTPPRELYESLVMLCGELSTFVRSERRVPELPHYDHDNLTLTFGDLAAVLSQSLSTVLEQTAIAMKLEEAKYGIRVSPLVDRNLLKDCQIILAVKADLATEDVQRRFPAQIKLGPVEHIRDLVNNHLPGIAISALPVAPRQIPYHAGYHYFILDNHGERWQQLQQSGGLAVHVSGNYPGLDMELWAIRP